MSKWCKYCVDRSSFFSTCYKCIITGSEKDVPSGYDKWYCYNENNAYSNCPLVKSYGWHITTGACDILNKKENDPVRVKHIWLKENIIDKDKKYDDFKNIYKYIGFLIKERLKEDEDKEEIASKVYLTLNDIVEDINNKDYDIATKRYIMMTLRLVALYGLQEEYRKTRDQIQTTKKMKKTLDK